MQQRRMAAQHGAHDRHPDSIAIYAIANSILGQDELLQRRISVCSTQRLAQKRYAFILNRVSAQIEMLKRRIRSQRSSQSSGAEQFNVIGAELEVLQSDMRIHHRFADGFRTRVANPIAAEIEVPNSTRIDEQHGRRRLGSFGANAVAAKVEMRKRHIGVQRIAH